MLYLLRNGYGAPELEALLDHQSGLKGVSELGSDVRELSELRKSNARCDLALRMFAYQVRKAIAAMAAALDGLGVLVFTGGIGEHSAEIRAEISQGLSWSGPFEMKVLPAQEDLQIARITERLAT